MLRYQLLEFGSNGNERGIPQTQSLHDWFNIISGRSIYSIALVD